MLYLFSLFMRHIYLLTYIFLIFINAQLINIYLKFQLSPNIASITHYSPPYTFIVFTLFLLYIIAVNFFIPDNDYFDELEAKYKNDIEKVLYCNYIMICKDIGNHLVKVMVISITFVFIMQKL